MSTNEAIGVLASLAVVLLILAVWRYINKKPTFPTAPLLNGLKYPRFQTFPTPRTFDSPGTVFRIDRSDIRFPVTTLPVFGHSGREALASYTTSSSWAFVALLRYLTGASDTKGSTMGSFGVSLKVVLEGGFREFTYDSEIDQLLKNALITYRKDSKYYVVRETISVSKITYDFKGGGKLEAAAKEAISNFVTGNQALAWTDNSRSILTQKFDRPYRVFFTADELLAPGLGMGESGPKRVRSDEPITWKDEQTNPFGSERKP
jgi:hypothetical protein